MQQAQAQVGEARDIETVAAYQQAVADMWQCYGNMLRLVYRDDADAARLAVGVVVHDSIRNLLICVGGALYSTLGHAVATARLPDDLARLQVSAFMVTRRADDLYDDAVAEEERKCRQMNADLDASQREVALARIASLHLAAALSMLAVFKADFAAAIGH